MITQISKEYAEALFELALGGNNVAEVTEAMETVERELAENPAYLDTLASPAILREQRVASLEAVFGDSVPKTALALLRMMVSRGHARAIPDMIPAYRKLAREFRGESTARVTSAVALSEAQKEQLKSSLEAKYARRMTVTYDVDPTLLGGVRVETEGSVMDGTIRNRLRQIKEVMDR